MNMFGAPKYTVNSWQPVVGSKPLLPQLVVLMRWRRAVVAYCSLTGTTSSAMRWTTCRRTLCGDDGEGLPYLCLDDGEGLLHVRLAMVEETDRIHILCFGHPNWKMN
jgi:hypothetical protein